MLLGLDGKDLNLTVRARLGLVLGQVSHTGNNGL